VAVEERGDAPSYVQRGWLVVPDAGHLVKDHQQRGYVRRMVVVHEAMARIRAAAASHAPEHRVLLPFGRGRRPDYNWPASVAAAFFTAWASVNTLRGGPDRSLAGSAGLVFPGLKRQLAARQTAPAGWRAMRAERLVSVVHVQAVTLADGAPAPRPGRVYLSVHARRITTTTTGER
jgi:hypothetical protein